MEKLFCAHSILHLTCALLMAVISINVKVEHDTSVSVHFKTQTATQSYSI